MKPPKTVVERAKANGSIDRASLLLSAAYLLNSEASNSDGRSRRHPVTERTPAWRAETASECLHQGSRQVFLRLRGESGKEKEYFTDLEDFDKAFRKWTKLMNIL